MTQPDTPAVDASLELADLDTRLGDLLVGVLPVRRTVLAEMGAQIEGKPISARHLARREADQTLLDSIRFAAPQLKAFLGADVTGSDNSASLLFEFAALRSTPAKPLLEMAPGPDSSDTMSRLDNLLRAVQNTNFNQILQREGLPAWVDTPRSRTLEAMGTGLQVYGYYSAINALAQAIRTGDIRQTLAAGAELLAELTSNALELALERLGKRMLENGGRVFKGFCASTVGQLLRRGAGLFAQVLTLPFDIYSAVQSLKDAAKSQGKEAMDHYVNAGFSLASAALGVVLGIAALAGFSYAGPLGIAAAVVLMLGAQIYSAVRQVDDIDDYIELSVSERLRAGWLSFAGRELDEDVRNRYLLARMEKQHAAYLTDVAEKWMRGALKSTVHAVVNGRFEVRMIPVRQWKHRWDEAAGEQPYVDSTAPAIHDADDVFDGSHAGVSQLPGVVLGAPFTHAAILWRLGGGNDDIRGLLEMRNIFQFGAGHKRLTGGIRDDQFVFDLSPDTLDAVATPGVASELHGGSGSDTLHLSNPQSYAEGIEGFAIDLDAGRVTRRKDAGRSGLSNQINLDSIENVATPAGMASHVKGSAQANLLIAEGNNDRIEAGAGDDTIIVNGADAWVDGGAGNDRYIIASNRGTVTLHEQHWQDDTLIELGWELSTIAAWVIQDCALVIRSLRGLDGELPERLVRIENLYLCESGERRLARHNLRLLTADGYTLEPVLPPLLSAQGDQPIKVAARSANPAPTFQRVLAGGEFVVPFGLSTRCFVERGAAEKRARVRIHGGATACTLYLDYSTEELIEVMAGYRVTLRSQNAVDSLTYSDVTLTLTFADGGRLVLADFASDRAAMRTPVVSNIRAASLKLDCEFVLVFKDGVSYRVQALQQSYLQDRAQPGFRAFEGRPALVARVGAYGFFRPPSAKGVWLQSQPQTLRIPAEPHRQSYALVGRGSVYAVYPSTGVTIALSTPGALAKTSDASTWLINTSGLDEVIDHSQISLVDHTLKVGSVTLNLPVVTDPQVPLEQLSVLTLEGDRYEIRLDLGSVFLVQLDASRYLTIADVWQQLRLRRQYSTLTARRLRVLGVQLADGTASAIHYDMLLDRWGADLDPARNVTSADLMRVSASLN
ncbi:calcium-binding protein [Pseudomonas hygromyciniae]|uniref:Calcium-binding protein n=1 Tax=Pseudomonas hygromyciniae TaxID=2812000 RepID=A0ABX7K371_9PSED|nr:calcium-binding protein [Pseudomonas hygromyciniae]MBN0980381.1 calcium-binding protein [Pseudomonas hygromyciniae]QSB41788.1 calcium-binding protein [Pseudomonas hygromyciniae]